MPEKKLCTTFRVPRAKQSRSTNWTETKEIVRHFGLMGVIIHIFFPRFTFMHHFPGNLITSYETFFSKSKLCKRKTNSNSNECFFDEIFKLTWNYWQKHCVNDSVFLLLTFSLPKIIFHQIWWHKTDTYSLHNFVVASCASEVHPHLMNFVYDDSICLPCSTSQFCLEFFCWLYWVTLIHGLDIISAQ